MTVAISEDRLAPVLDAIYDAAVLPDGWPAVLRQLSEVFNSHFVDVFARTDDWSDYRGLAVGLDKADYEDEFLDGWCKRNVWSRAKPVRVAGEVLPTWKMVEKQDVLRSDIYNGFLKQRGLNEGLRLAIWAGEGWIQDISLLRPWSAGAFDLAEIGLGTMLLPHLQRAARASRQLAGMKAACSLDGMTRPAFLVDQRGRVIRLNSAADDLLAASTELTIRDGRLTAPCMADAGRLDVAIASAAAMNGMAPEGSTLEVSASLQLTMLPVRAGTAWEFPGPRGVLVFGTVTAGRDRLSSEDLATRFKLTRAEADFALDLMSGMALPDIAQKVARSIHTVRSHLARVMAKTHTRRQMELVHLLMSLDRAKSQHRKAVLSGV